MHINGSIALVTGANRGLGREFARQLRERGAAEVYATSRATGLDITDPAQVRAVAEGAPDVTLLINNAGVSTGHNLVTGDLAEIRREMDTHFWGTLHMVRAFAPILAANGGGAVLNVLSALSWFAYDGSNAYAAAKAAEWNLTNGVRLELARQGTQVTGLHLGAADTDMMAGYDGPKSDPAVIVAAALDGLEAGRLEVVADDWSASVKASLAGDPAAFYHLDQPSASNR
jgi:NAD(P)-dependent dehydrogenase (short-subunit alcohol dehydrogenase family)